MAKFKKVFHGKHEGKIVYGEGIIDKIVVLAVEELPFVDLYFPSDDYKNTKAVKVSLNKSNASVEVQVKVHYSQSISDMAFKIQEAVKHSVESMTEYKITAVNVNVKGVIFEEIEQKQNELKEDKSIETEKSKPESVDSTSEAKVVPSKIKKISTSNKNKKVDN